MPSGGAVRWAGKTRVTGRSRKSLGTAIARYGVVTVIPRLRQQGGSLEGVPAPHRADIAARLLLGRAEHARLGRLRFKDAGHGYDVLGMHPPAVRLWAGLLRVLYERYFRVESNGSEHIPRHGPAILAVNHSGILPIDAAMVFFDVLHHTDPPRIPRPVGDVFIPLVPFVSTLLSRVGVVTGTRTNFRYLVESGELVLVFPEGTPGIGKGYGKRYQLQDWRAGHAELAIRHRVPVIPVAVIGAEEAWPELAKIESFRWFGAPWLPIPATPLPLPVKFHIRYGAPILLYERWPPDSAYDPEISNEAAAVVKSAIAHLLREGMRERKGVFT